MALPLAIRHAGLPLHFTWAAYFKTYWIALALQSVFLATLLYVIAGPLSHTLQPLWDRYRREKFRVVLALAFVAFLISLFGILLGLLLAVDAIALIEFVDRTRSRRDNASQKTLDILLPATYLFFGLVIVFSYNDVIAALRFDGSADVLLNRMDIWLLRGASVSSIAHWFLARFSLVPFRWMSWIYFLMFPQIGAGLLLLSFNNGRETAMRFVATILTAYYLALICFYLLPATGPYFICPTHFSLFPADIGVYASQRTFIAELTLLRARRGLSVIGTDYFIALPCMHITQPIIVLWYLRKWKRITAILAAFDLALCAAILLLEQHYAVDLLGGIALAPLAIGMMAIPAAMRPQLEMKGQPQK